MPARQERRSTAGGRLDAEQVLTWEGASPDLPPGALLDLMERLHWRTVARYGFGMVRVRHEEAVSRPPGAVSRRGTPPGPRPDARPVGAVSCDVLGRVPALVFEREGDRVDAGRIERRWRIGGGALVRPVGPDAWTRGTFAIGLAGEDRRLRAWVRVEAFPSRFLLTRGGWLAEALAGLYSRFHARVSFAYLEALRRQLSETTTRPSTPA